MAKSAAILSGLPLYSHLTSALSSSSSSSVSLPTPLTSLLAGGAGKLRVREFCILPLPGRYNTPSIPTVIQSVQRMLYRFHRTLSEQILALGSVYRSVGTLLSAKTGVRQGKLEVWGGGGGGGGRGIGREKGKEMGEGGWGNSL